MKTFIAHEPTNAEEHFAEYLLSCLAVVAETISEMDTEPHVSEGSAIGNTLFVQIPSGTIFSVTVQTLLPDNDNPTE